MDPVTAAALAGLTAFVTRSTQDLLDAVGNATADRLRKLFAAVKARLSGDEAAAGDLERFADNPKLYAPVVQTRLDEMMAADPGFRSDVQQLLGELGPQLSVVQRIAEAQGVTGVDVDEFCRGQLSVEQEMTHASNVTGARIKSIG
jgi:hypothetical protein